MKQIQNSRALWTIRKSCKSSNEISIF